MNRGEPDMPPPQPAVKREEITAEGQRLQLRFTLIFMALAILPILLFIGYELSQEKGKKNNVSGGLPMVRFVESATAAGIHFRHENGASGEKLLPETMGSGCAIWDFDNDGDQDLLFVSGCAWNEAFAGSKNGGSLLLYENDGKGKFRDVSKAKGLLETFYGMGLAMGDFDNDGWTDFYVTAVGRNYLYHNQQGRGFIEVAPGAGVAGATNAWSTSAAWIDYDRDSDLDLFVCNYVEWSREIDLKINYQLPGIGRAYGPPMNFTGTVPYLFRNEGNGRFTNVAEFAGLHVTNKATGLPMAKGLGIAPVDLDGDGWI
ncbi:MAG: FG-GAP-like repeat-containing protein, partial [Verrucomicrobiota bacterium]|nr:FG-GAP-like repeat-containing protein [Verrucomicrobiota bacterium]